MAQYFDSVVIGGGIVGSAIAEGLAAMGRSVALIERGGATIDKQEQAKPLINCTNRIHAGCFKARNHVLGGNGYYWGGGLIRPPNMGLYECLGIPMAAHQESATLASNFKNVEQLLNIFSPPIRTQFHVDDSEIGDCELSEIFVLPGSERNTALKQLKKFSQIPHCEIYTGADIVSFSHNGKAQHGRNITSIIINQGGRLLEIASRQFVIATGVVDCNLLVQAHSQELGVSSVEIDLGSRLHDHLSIPIARVRVTPNHALKNMLAPSFRNGLVVGRRFELKCESGWGACGLLHFALQFDDISPYREIKQLLFLRQQRASYLELAKVAIPLLSVTPELLKIAIERVLNQRLYIAEGLSVCATLDFESFPHSRNTLRLRGDRADFAWDITEEDELAYLELLDKSFRLLAQFSHSYGMVVEPLVDSAVQCGTIDYLRVAATDAFHLGGGLAVGVDSKGAVDLDLRLSGTENVFVVSSAVMRRPGIVNPTHTLLALADRFVKQHNHEREKYSV